MQTFFWLVSQSLFHNEEKLSDESEVEAMWLSDRTYLSYGILAMHMPRGRVLPCTSDKGYGDVLYGFPDCFGLT